MNMRNPEKHVKSFLCKILIIDYFFMALISNKKVYKDVK